VRSTWASAPGRCVHVAIAVFVALLFALACSSARAEPKKRAEPKANPAAAGLNGDKAAAAPGPKKEKTYTFGGLDIDGKLKTPQLLYFLNRMKSEFDTTTPDKRSFIPELKRSTDEM
jgi:hypothetical protein